jgi:hypothetical protein
VTFLEAELELLEQATLPTEEEGHTLTGRSSCYFYSSLLLIHWEEESGF